MKLKRVLLAGAVSFIGFASLASADITAKGSLGRIVPETKIDATPLGDALDFVRDISNANIHVDWKALEAAGVGRDATVSLHVRNVSLRKLLSLMLNEAGSGNLLTYYVDGNVIEVTTREIADRQLITKVYPIQDLIVEVPDFDQPPSFNINTSTPTKGGGGSQSIFGGNTQEQTASTRAERAQQLIDVITSIIQPDVWTTNGGTAAIRFFSGNLIVTAPRSVHEALGDAVE